MNNLFWKNKKVFLTGHTGFKGSWLSLWLTQMGAKVYGYSLDPYTTPNLFDILQLKSRIQNSQIADLRDIVSLKKSLKAASPDIVIHMAAQPLVRYSYVNPLETYETNVMGTINLFEAIRESKSVRAVINVTTDKCYENKEWIWPYRENEAMGGFDPYSNSKACSELITSSYRRSFFNNQGILLASARAGNVIGGGDWSKERLIPDFLNALDSKETLLIRSPNAIRPWQHVLEPLNGYLKLAEKLYLGENEFAEGWNFGPNENDSKPVMFIVEHLCARAGGASWDLDKKQQPHEANILKLDTSKARQKLQWHPRWDLEYTLDKILEWHDEWKNDSDMYNVCLKQISDYETSV
ncbi:CDP-glucose 4,6-dehydratase [Francisella marina]|uniref:CDP-glucose 4,6-dehydratase n=1 Tax=Francisella marina TaxID=2249302 RepID=A0ABX5ZHI1_9GAMM|nr:CDP-glucose 4,6-dehydratase [Francisella marina]QEO57916.1 CDP-glucose 4,6-dehydratase [Francisella marina]QEO59857.1 CDP-glucose 4,6-dehydratase [Francisella marina]